MASMLGDPQIDHSGGLGVDQPQQVVSPEQMQQMQAEASQLEQARKEILSRIMHPKALARIANIAAANPHKARSLEDRFINSAREGQILEQVTEQDLVKMIGASNREKGMQAKIKFARRKSLLDSAGTDPEFVKRLGIDISFIEGWDEQLSDEASASQYSDISVEEPADTGEAKDGDSDGDDDDDAA